MGREPRWTLRAFRLPGGAEVGKNPTDRSKNGTKRHGVVDRKGIPLAIELSGASPHEVKKAEEAVDAIPDVEGKLGHPRKRPEKLHADKAMTAKLFGKP
jgi:hypothetical protein